jgi:hypothetical protein
MGQRNGDTGPLKNATAHLAILEVSVLNGSEVGYILKIRNSEAFLEVFQFSGHFNGY